MLVITEVKPHRLGWLFYYQSQEYLRSGSISSALAGNGPILVSKHDGSYVRVGTGAPLEESLAEAKRELTKNTLRQPK